MKKARTNRQPASNRKTDDGDGKPVDDKEKRQPWSTYVGDKLNEYRLKFIINHKATNPSVHVRTFVKHIIS